MDRDRLLAFVRAGAHGWWLVPKPDLAVAFLLADQGPSPRLDGSSMRYNTPHDPRTAKVTAWLRSRSAAAPNLTDRDTGSTPGKP